MTRHDRRKVRSWAAGDDSWNERSSVIVGTKHQVVHSDTDKLKYVPLDFSNMLAVGPQKM
jgi:hypothetical protein